MSFLSNMINEFTHKGSQPQNQGGYSGQQQGYQQQSNSGRPQPPAPWIAEWDQNENRWIYINRETGQRTHEFPQQYGGGYDNRGYGQQGPPGYPQQNLQYEQQPQEKKSHTGRNVALGAVAGLAGGALLMHEGEKVEEKWDEDKYLAEERVDSARYRADYDADRVENWGEQKVYDGVQDVENFPENAARWTGEKVQEVEDIPEDVDRKWDNFKQDVEDVPEDIAYGVGDVAGDVDRFGNRIGDAYDDGRDDQRYDDDRNDRW